MRVYWGYISPHLAQQDIKLGLYISPTPRIRRQWGAYCVLDKHTNYAILKHARHAEPRVLLLDFSPQRPKLYKQLLQLGLLKLN